MDVDFEHLIKLQNLDAELTEISLFFKNLPSEINKIEQKFEESSQIVAQAKEKLAQNQKQRRELESAVQDLKAPITKYKHQLNEVKSNKEYKSLLKEIEETQEKINSLEEEIISKMLAADDNEEEIRTANHKATEIKENLSQEKDVLLREKNEVEEKRKKLLKEKEALVSKIPSDQMILYKKIFEKKNGVVLSPVSDDFCDMCHMRIRPQMINELKEQTSIMLCENCGRILYWLKKSPSS